MLYGALMWAVTVYAFRRGSWVERTAAAGVVINTYLSVLLVSPKDRAYRQIEVQVAMIDLVLFVIALLMALRSRKYWPLWFAAMQGVGLLAHLAPLVPGMLPSTYYNAVALWGYPMLIVLALGVRANHHASRKPRSAAVSS